MASQGEPDWNQILLWLREMDSLREGVQPSRVGAQSRWRDGSGCPVVKMPTPIGTAVSGPFQSNWLRRKGDLPGVDFAVVVPRRTPFLRPMHGTLARIHVEHDPVGPRRQRSPREQLPVHGREPDEVLRSLNRSVSNQCRVEVSAAPRSHETVSLSPSRTPSLSPQRYCGSSRCSPSGPTARGLTVQGVNQAGLIAFPRGYIVQTKRSGSA